jgi:ring-1,2-phenylacetyl-CoA epoxidase subunit PaaE
MVSYTLKIVDIIQETLDSCTICFKQPALRKIKYLPGQYVTLVVTINNRKYKRPYSLSSALGIDNTLNITVKRLFQGIVSNHLMDVVKVGDLLEVMEPIGDFVYNNSSTNDSLFLWGGGSGITPLMSILKAALQKGSTKVALIYCNKTKQEAIFYNQLMKLKKQYSNNFFLELFCTSEYSDDTIHGRITENYIYDLLKRTSIPNVQHYICGPVGLKDSVKQALTKFGIKQNQIFSEDFEHFINEDELENVKSTFVELKKGQSKLKIEVTRGKSVLEAALDGQIDLPYSCQTGSCTLCKAKLLSGEVKQICTEKLEHDITDDERLLCCSYPLTDNIIFEID